MNETELVYSIICDAPNPLMAKEIVRIFEKQYGYKISKKDVKNIIWNDLKGKIHFDKINFTYTTKENLKNKIISKPNVIQIPNLNNKVEIDGYSIVIIETKNELGPIFWVKVNGLILNIYLNVLHPKSVFLKSTEGHIFLLAICRTSVSFSDNLGEIFLNRLKNYIEII